MCSIWPLPTTSLRSPAPGTATPVERIGQGRENTRSFLKENTDIFARMDAELRTKLKIGVTKAEVPEVPAAGPAEAKEAVRVRRG